MGAPPAAARPRNSSRARGRATGSARSRSGGSGRSSGSRRGAAPTLPPLARRILLGAGAALLGLFLLSVLERIAYSGQVMPGVEVQGVSVAGLGERSAFTRIDDLAGDLETSVIKARAGDVELAADPSTVRLDVDQVATLRTARTAGRSGNPLEQMAGTLLRRFRPDEVPLQVRYDERGLEGLIDGWMSQTSAGVSEGGLRFEGTTVVPVEPHAGMGIERDKARRLLDRALLSASRRTVVLPVGHVEPKVDAEEVRRAADFAERLLADDFTIDSGVTTITITPEQLVTAMGTEIRAGKLEVTVNPLSLAAALGESIQSMTVAPVDARFEVNSDSTVSVVPSQNGRELNFAKIVKEILLVHRRIDAPLVEKVPEHDTAWAQSLGIKGLVSTFTTEHPAGQSRVTNIHMAADIINNAVVEPGEVFSLNDAIGPRTPDRGFVTAPVIYGEFTEDYGGGVSQLATTFFNAVFYGGYESVTHKPHSIYISRYPMVVESTLSYPGVDLQFRNDTDAGVLVRTGYGDSSITVSFYGDNGGRVVTKEGPNILEERPIEIEYIDWPLLPVGEEDEIDSGHTGYVVEVFRIIEEPGKETVRERFSWTYRMTPRKILRGTMEPTTTTTTTNPTSSSTPTSSTPGPTSPSPTTTPPAATTTSAP